MWKISYLDKNLDKANTIYMDLPNFDKTQYNSLESKCLAAYPVWLIKQSKSYMVSTILIDIFMKQVYFPSPSPDNYHQQSTKLYSKPIRQEIYGIMEVKEIYENIPYKRYIRE